MKKILKFTISMAVLMGMFFIASPESHAQTAAEKQLALFKKSALKHQIMYGNGTEIGAMVDSVDGIAKLGKPLKKEKFKKSKDRYSAKYTYKNNLVVTLSSFELHYFDPNEAWITDIKAKFKQKVTYKDLKKVLKTDLYATDTYVDYYPDYDAMGRKGSPASYYEFTPAKKITKKNPLTNKTVFVGYTYTHVVGY